MNKKIKFGVAKYLLAAASLLPMAKAVEAKNKTKENLPSVGEYTLAFGAGFEHLLPSGIINSQIKGTDLEGFNPGFFVEIGTMNCSGQHGKTNYEHYIGFFGRFDYHNFHSRAYNVNGHINANILAGEPLSYVDASEHGCAHVQDYMGTINFESGIGWYGVSAGINLGAGWHFDDHGNFGPVCVLGYGMGYRFNENVRLDAKWRLNIFPFENLNSKTHLYTAPGLRNNVELSIVYKLKAFYKGQQDKYRTKSDTGRLR